MNDIKVILNPFKLAYTFETSRQYAKIDRETFRFDKLEYSASSEIKYKYASHDFNSFSLTWLLLYLKCRQIALFLHFD